MFLHHMIKVIHISSIFLKECLTSWCVMSWSTYECLWYKHWYLDYWVLCAIQNSSPISMDNSLLKLYTILKCLWLDRIVLFSAYISVCLRAVLRSNFSFVQVMRNSGNSFSAIILFISHCIIKLFNIIQRWTNKR